MLFIFLGALIVLVIIYYATKNDIINSGDGSASDEDVFQQGNVRVEFGTGKISIGKFVYDVDQVTGIRSEPYGRTAVGAYNDRDWKAVISVDDLVKPRHEIIFRSARRAEDFTQRLCVAIRKADGPSFV